MNPFVTQVQWIKRQFGGRSRLPLAGLRSTIRFQRHVKEWLQGGWDVQILDVDNDANTWEARVHLQLIKDESPFKDFIKEGELFELLEGFKVVGVGRIVSVDK